MFFFNHCCCGRNTVTCRPVKPECDCDRPHCDLADRECCCLRCRQESQNCRCRENKCENNCRCCERKCNCCRCCEKRHECPCSHGGMNGDYDN